MKIIIIGAGLIGQERISALLEINKLYNNIIDFSVFDINKEQLQKVKNKFNINILNSLDEVFNIKSDWVFIATTNNVAPNLIKRAFDTGSNVLVEKPLGINLETCEDVLKHKPNHLKLFVGFNYRFFNGVEVALHDAKNGKFGKLISVNLILAHGNSPESWNSWYLDPIKRGSLAADLGVHLFDIILQLSNYQSDINIKYIKTWKGFFNTGIDEEAHIILTDSFNIIYNTQISYTRWRSNFRLEINGTEGYGIVEGRGRSYGPQSYRTGIRWGWQSGKKQAETETIVIDGDDCSNSFVKETAAVLGLNTYTSSPCSYLEAQKVMFLLDQIKNN